jgi:hypothetical protein
MEEEEYVFFTFFYTAFWREVVLISWGGNLFFICISICYPSELDLSFASTGVHSWSLSSCVHVILRSEQNDMYVSISTINRWSQPFHREPVPSIGAPILLLRR